MNIVMYMPRYHCEGGMRLTGDTMGNETERQARAQVDVPTAVNIVQNTDSLYTQIIKHIHIFDSTAI